jgi:mannosyltransferase
MDHRELYVLLGITALATLVRFATLDHQSFDHDEAVTAIRVIHPTLRDTLSVVGRNERSPPLYYILAWLWSKLFGTGEVGLRSLSALFGMLTVPAAYLTARRLASPVAGAIAAALVALNPYLVWYSQEARSYALFALLAAWALLYFVRALHDPSRRNLALWAVFSCLALCSHYFAAFLIAPEGLWLIASVRKRGPAIAAVAATSAAGLALLPLAIAQEGQGRRNLFANLSLARRAGEAALHLVAGQEPGLFVRGPTIDRVQLAAGLAGFVLVCAAAFLVIRRGTPRERRGAATVAGIGLIGCAAPFGLALVGIDYVDPHNLIGSITPLLVAAGVAYGARRAGLLGVATAACAALLFVAMLAGIYVSAQMERPDWRGAAAAIGRPHGARVLVVPRNGDDGLVYYLGAREFKSRTFRRRGVRVREIDVLSTSFATTPPGRGFKLVEQRGLAPLGLLRRYRAPRPVRILPREVSGHKILAGRSTALVDGLRGA